MERATSPLIWPHGSTARTWINVRGALYHPMTQGRIERWHQTFKNRILLENYYLPGDLEAEIGAFVADYNRLRYQDSLGSDIIRSATRPNADALHAFGHF